MLGGCGKAAQAEHTQTMEERGEGFEEEHILLENHDVTEKKGEGQGLKSHEKGKRSKEKKFLQEGEEKRREEREIFKPSL